MERFCRGNRISIIPTILFYLLMFYSGATGVHTIEDEIGIIIVIYIIMQSIMRIIHWTIAYKASVFLYFLLFGAFIGIFIGEKMLQQTTIGNVVGATVIFILVSIYFAILIVLRRKGIMKKSPPGIRFAILRAYMNIWERITLVFPNRYLKYLETGDEKYLEEKDGQ